MAPKRKRDHDALEKPSPTKSKRQKRVALGNGGSVTLPCDPAKRPKQEIVLNTVSRARAGILKDTAAQHAPQRSGRPRKDGPQGPKEGSLRWLAANKSGVGSIASTSKSSLHRAEKRIEETGSARKRKRALQPPNKILTSEQEELVVEEAVRRMESGRQRNREVLLKFAKRLQETGVGGPKRRKGKGSLQYMSQLLNRWGLTQRGQIKRTTAQMRPTRPQEERHFRDNCRAFPRAKLFAMDESNFKTDHLSLKDYGIKGMDGLGTHSHGEAPRLEVSYLLLKGCFYLFHYKFVINFITHTGILLGGVQRRRSRRRKGSLSASPIPLRRHPTPQGRAFPNISYTFISTIVPHSMNESKDNYLKKKKKKKPEKTRNTRTCAGVPQRDPTVGSSRRAEVVRHPSVSAPW